jgi:hypothetical protein
MNINSTDPPSTVKMMLKTGTPGVPIVASMVFQVCA